MKIPQGSSDSLTSSNSQLSSGSPDESRPHSINAGHRAIPGSCHSRLSGSNSTARAPTPPLPPPEGFPRRGAALTRSWVGQVPEETASFSTPAKPLAISLGIEPNSSEPQWSAPWLLLLPYVFAGSHQGILGAKKVSTKTTSGKVRQLPMNDITIIRCP